MSQTTINRYLPGGDIYAKLQSLFGTSNANYIASAAETGDETQVNAALTQVKYGSPLNTSTSSILANQLTTNPFAAPLSSANSILGSGFGSLLKSPWVVAAGVAILFSVMGGWAWLGKKVFK